MQFPELDRNFVRDVVSPQLLDVHCDTEARRWTSHIEIIIHPRREPPAPLFESVFSPHDPTDPRTRITANIVLTSDSAPLVMPDGRESGCFFRTEVYARISPTRDVSDHNAFSAVFMSTRLMFTDPQRNEAFVANLEMYPVRPERTLHFETLAAAIQMRPRIFAAREARHENVLIPAIAAPQRVEFPNYHGSSVSAELLDALRTDENAQIKVADAVFTRLQEYLATRVQGFVADDWFEIHRLCECMHVLK